MSRYFFVALLLGGVALTGQPAWGQSPTYHLERLQIQARAFLETLEPVTTPVSTDTTATVTQQLEQSTSNSVWSRQMVTDDVNKIIETSGQLSNELVDADADRLLSAKSTVESLSRRLRVSSAALVLTPQSKTALDFLMLELDESSRVMEIQREQLIAQEQNRRRSRSGVSIGLGYGYGYGYGSPFGYGLGGWGSPLGWGSYYPYGYGFGPRPYYSGYGGRVYGIGPRGCR